MVLPIVAFVRLDSWTTRFRYRPMTTHDRFVSNTKRLMRKHNLSQLELARRTGMARTHVNGVINSKIGVTLTTIENFARVLNAEPWEMLK